MGANSLRALVERRLELDGMHRADAGAKRVGDRAAAARAGLDQGVDPGGALDRAQVQAMQRSHGRSLPMRRRYTQGNWLTSFSRPRRGRPAGHLDARRSTGLR
jgi:hypothetical protein